MINGGTASSQKAQRQPDCATYPPPATPSAPPTPPATFHQIKARCRSVRCSKPVDSSETMAGV
ncbi:hypothetical protein GCM10028864_09910 [Microlunatus parietis]